MRTYNSKLVDQVVMANEWVMSLTKQVQGLKEALEVVQHIIPRYQVVIGYKDSVGFRRGLERSRATSDQ